MLVRFGNAQILACLTLSLLMAANAGCNSDSREQAGTAKVHGEITLDGLPVDQAKVIFLPVDLRSRTGKLMPLAFGLTNSDGKFELKYSDGVDELIAGKYTVIISKAKENQTKAENDARSWDTNLLPGDVGQFENFKNPDDLFPTIYNRDSILVYDVKASATIDHAKFELSSIDPALRDLSKAQ